MKNNRARRWLSSTCACCGRVVANLWLPQRGESIHGNVPIPNTHLPWLDVVHAADFPKWSRDQKHGIAALKKADRLLDRETAFALPKSGRIPRGL